MKCIPACNACPVGKIITNDFALVSIVQALTKTAIDPQDLFLCAPAMRKTITFPQKEMILGLGKEANSGTWLWLIFQFNQNTFIWQSCFGQVSSRKPDHLLISEDNWSPLGQVFLE